VIKYLYSALLAITVGAYFYMTHMQNKIEVLNKDIEMLNEKQAIDTISMENEIFEVEQAIIFDNEKESNVSEIPTAVGNNTISF